MPARVASPVSIVHSVLSAETTTIGSIISRGVSFSLFSCLPALDWLQLAPFLLLKMNLSALDIEDAFVDTVGWGRQGDETERGTLTYIHYQV